MFAELKDVLTRSHRTMAADAAGLVLLVAMFLMALNLTILV